jgi:hypothetical protein
VRGDRGASAGKVSQPSSILVVMDE